MGIIVLNPKQMYLLPLKLKDCLLSPGVLKGNLLFPEFDEDERKIVYKKRDNYESVIQ